MVLTSQDITNLYLYGVKSTPLNLTDDSLIRDGFSKDNVPYTLIEIDTREYLENGAGRFAVGAQFGLVKDFFESSAVPAGDYSKKEIADKLGLTFYGWNMNQYNWADDTDDYLERVYVYNTSAFKISDDARFIINTKGEKRIEKFRVEPNNNVEENFDFIGGGELTHHGNIFLEANIDPSGIGRKVKIAFKEISGAIPKIIYTKENYIKEKDIIDNWTYYYDPVAATKLFINRNVIPDKLFASGTTRFLDKNNRPILYGTNNDDSLEALKLREIAPKLAPFLDNGAYLIAGKGDDKLFGSSGDDIFWGGIGDDEIFGNYPINNVTGIDVAKYIGSYSDYEVEFLPNRVVRINDKVSNRDGLDTLNSINFAAFSDISISLHPCQDIFFAIDVSRIMIDDIFAVKEEIKKRINKIFDSELVNSRVAIITFNDSYTFRNVLDFTSHSSIDDRRSAALKSLERNVSILRGGEEPTGSVLTSAIYGGLGKWRDDVKEKKIIVFSDEAPSDTAVFNEALKTADNFGIKVDTKPMNLTPLKEDEEGIVNRSTEFDIKVNGSFASCGPFWTKEPVQGIGTKSISWPGDSLTFQPNETQKISVPVYWDRDDIALDDSQPLSQAPGVFSLGKINYSNGPGGASIWAIDLGYGFELNSSDGSTPLDLSFQSGAIRFNLNPANNSIGIQGLSPLPVGAASIVDPKPGLDIEIPVYFELVASTFESDDSNSTQSNIAFVEEGSSQEIELFGRLYTWGPRVTFPLSYWYPTLTYQRLTDEGVDQKPGQSGILIKDTSEKYAYLHANFQPNYGLNTDQAAYLLGYDYLDWYQTTTHGFTESDNESTLQAFSGENGSLSFIDRPVVGKDWEKVEFETHLVGVDETNQIGSESIYTLRWGTTFKPSPSDDDILLNYEGGVYFLDRYSRPQSPPSPLEQDTFISNDFTADELLGNDSDDIEIVDTITDIQATDTSSGTDSLVLGSSDISSPFSIPGDSLIQNDFTLNVDAFAAQPSILL